jgi:hypothetical protein
MRTVKYLPEDELIARGLKALTEALGPVEAVRFLTLPRGTRIESVRRHRLWQAGLDPQQFLDQVFGVVANETQRDSDR